MNNIFENIGAENIIRRSQFDLSYEHMTTLDFGELVPIGWQEVVPGDVVSLKAGGEAVVRITPLVAPCLQEIILSVHHFVCSKRALWELGGYSDTFEEFITRGEDGTSAPTHPTWTVTDHAVGSLWDKLGLPIGVDPQGVRPDSMLRDMYNNIYNEYYRDQHINAEVALTNESILHACHFKDYFYSAQTTQILGTAPSFPISGNVPVLGIGKTNQNFLDSTPTVYETSGLSTVYSTAAGIDDAVANQAWRIEEDPDNPGYPNIRANLASAVTFDIADFRLALCKTLILELNQRAGSRYIEQSVARYGVAPIDERLYRSEYLGGSKHNITISEVLNTNGGSAPLGDMAGHGLGVVYNDDWIRYRVKEFGYIMTIVCIRPTNKYSPQGVDRQLIKSDVEDYFFPEYTELSEREILSGELYATAVSASNNLVFGYQSEYDELRQKRDIVTGKFRVGQNMDHYHCAVSFASRPTLNSTFITADSVREEIAAAPSEPLFLLAFGNRCEMVRPLPYKPIPGLMPRGINR